MENVEILDEELIAFVTKIAKKLCNVDKDVAVVKHYKDQFLNELLQSNIPSLGYLVELAEISNDWNEKMGQFTTELRTRLNKWREENFPEFIEPPQSQALADFTRFQAKINAKLFLNVPSSKSVPSRTPVFKKNLCERYQCGDINDGYIRCMVMNIKLPSEVVIASHIFRRFFAHLSSDLMGFNNIDDVKNGLLLFKPVKWAFDTYQLSFIYNNQTNEYHVVLFSTEIREKRLVDCCCLSEEQRLKIANCEEYNVETKFSNIEGKCLSFNSLDRPFNRCLNFQARLARLNAIERGWINENEKQFDDFCSDVVDVPEKIDMFMKTLKLSDYAELVSSDEI